MYRDTSSVDCAHKTHTYNICMTKHSYFTYTSTYSSTHHNTNKKHNIHHTPYTNIQHTSTLQGYLQQRRLHNKHSHRSPHSHHNRHKNNMRNVHTSIVSRHLATRGNSKILRTPPPHISSCDKQHQKIPLRHCCENFGTIVQSGNIRLPPLAFVLCVCSI